MTSIAYYFAGLATLPILVVILRHLFPRQTVDNQCTFCREITRHQSWAEAQEYAKQHVMRCKLHPMSRALERIEELEAERSEA